MEYSGFILINKPSGPTSHDIVDVLRRLSGIKKIGHAGTLDPMASGLLILAVSRSATKEIDKFSKMDKEYEAEITFGISTDSYDKMGKIIFEYKGLPIVEQKIEKILKKFLGKQEQLPPMHSAKKVKGKKLYDLARKGIEIDRQKQKIEIYGLEILKYQWPKLDLRISCSSGTYIRSLAQDFGEIMKCGAHLSALRRTKIGKFSVESAVNLKDLTSDNWHDYLFIQQSDK